MYHPVYIYIFILLYTFIYIRTRAIYGNHICKRNCVKKKEKVETSQGRGRSNKQSIILYENNTNNQHTSQCITITTQRQRNNYNPHTHTITHSLIHESYVLANIFKILGDTVWNTVWKLYISMLPIYIYIYIQEPYIFLYDLNNPRETIASFLASGKRWNHCHGS